VVNEYKIKAVVEAKPELQFLLAKIEGLKAQRTNELNLDDFFNSDEDKRYNNLALKLQIDALENYVEQQIREAINAAWNNTKAASDHAEWSDDQHGHLLLNDRVDDSKSDNLEETSRTGAN
jgi:hypothetical protein